MQGWFHTELASSIPAHFSSIFSSKELTSGANTHELERSFESYFSVKHAIFTNSGTSALAMSLLALDIGVGDEVIVPAVGWIATAQAVSITGATPIIVDTEPFKTNICFQSLQSKLSSKTKAVIPVNYNGRQVDINKLRSFLPTSVAIVEDSCKSMFSKSFDVTRLSGTNGDIGCFSLGMISMLPSCYGGFAITNNTSLYEKMKLIKFHGVSYGPEIYRYPSFNFKTSNVFATFALEMLKSVNVRVDRLNHVYRTYEEGLRDTPFNLLPVDLAKGEIPLLIDIFNPEVLSHQALDYFNSANIQCLGYHPSLSSATYIKSDPTPNADWLTSRTFHLPCGPDQNLSNITNALDALSKFTL